MIIFSSNNNFKKENVPLVYLRTKEASLPFSFQGRREPRAPLTVTLGTFGVLPRAVKKVSYHPEGNTRRVIPRAIT